MAFPIEVNTHNVCQHRIQVMHHSMKLNRSVKAMVVAVSCPPGCCCCFPRDSACCASFLRDIISTNKEMISLSFRSSMRCCGFLISQKVCRSLCLSALTFFDDNSWNVFSLSLSRNCTVGCDALFDPANLNNSTPLQYNLTRSNDNINEVVEDKAIK